jgi:hypothetical protein
MPKEKSPEQVMKELPVEQNADLEMYGKLRNEINLSRDKYKLSLQQTKDAIEQRTQELELLNTRKQRLEGAIEASEYFLKAVLPSNNPK